MEMYNRFRGDYRDQDGAQFWESVLIGRRLLLCFATLIPNLIAQLVICLMLCIIFLLHHQAKHPFENWISNQVEMFSLLFLCGRASINLMRAFYISMGISPDSPQANMMDTFALVESLCLPVLVAVIIFLEIVHKNKKGE